MQIVFANTKPYKTANCDYGGAVDDNPMWWFMSANAEAVGYKPVNMIPFRLHAVEGILWPCLPTTSTVAVALA